MEADECVIYNGFFFSIMQNQKWFILINVNLDLPALILSNNLYQICLFIH